MQRFVTSLLEKPPVPIILAAGVGALGVIAVSLQKRWDRKDDERICESATVEWAGQTRKEAVKLTMQLEDTERNQQRLSNQLRGFPTHILVDVWGAAVPLVARLMLPVGKGKFGVVIDVVPEKSQCSVSLKLKGSWGDTLLKKLEEFAVADKPIMFEIVVDKCGLNPELLCLAPVLPSLMLRELRRSREAEVETTSVSAASSDAAVQAALHASRPRRRSIWEAVTRWALLPVGALLGSWALLLRTREVLELLPQVPGFAWTSKGVHVSRVLPPLPKTLLEAFDLGALCERASGSGAAAALEAAGAMLGRSVSREELAAIREELVKMLAHKSVTQRVMGFFSFVNVMWLAAILGITISVGPVAWVITKPIRKLLQQVLTVVFEKVKKVVVLLLEKVIVPLVTRLHTWGVWEACAHLLAFSLVAQGARTESTAGVYITLSGLVALYVACNYTHKLHGRGLVGGLKEQLGLPGKAQAALVCAGHGLTLVPLAVLHQSTLLGYAATMSFLSAMGFGGAMHPFCYCIGWDSKDDAARTGMACGLAMAGFAAARIWEVNSRYLAPFVSSVSVLGGLGHFLALLILSNRWHHRHSANELNSYGIYNAGMLASLMGFQYVGRVYGLGGLANTTTTFFVLWVLEKAHELNDALELSGWFLVLGGSLVTYYSALWLHSNPEFVVSMFRSL